MHPHRWTSESNSAGRAAQRDGEPDVVLGAIGECGAYVRDEKCIIRTGVLTCEVVPK